MRRARAVLPALLLAATWCAGCDGEQTPAPAPGAADPVAAIPAASTQTYAFECTFPRTWNNTVYVATGTDIDPARPFGGRILDDFSRFEVEARPGERWMLRTEPALTPAERIMLWHVEESGTFGEDGLVLVTGPRRAEIHVKAPGSQVADQLVLHHEASGASASAIRDEIRGLLLTIWDAHAAQSYKLRAPPRPWLCGDFAPGECVIAARTEGRQWVAMRADVSPGRQVVVEAGVAPKGGGTVIAEDALALLLLGGELPLPAPRVTAAQMYRSTWRGVPPGEHVVRYPDGAEVPVTVEDGGEVKLPKR